jgi:heptosyltransferase-1
LQTQSKFRLLVVRLGAMGDILHALPAVTALRQMHPGWIIDWVVEPRWRALLSAKPNTEGDGGFNPSIEPAESPRASAPEAQPIVDQLHLAPTRQWRSSPLSRKTIHEISALRRALRAGAYDTVLDLQGAIRSAVVARLAGSQRLIGEEDPRERAARLFYTERVSTHSAHVIEQDIELAAAVAGDDLHPVAPWLPIDPAAEAWADGILPLQPGPGTARVSPATVLVNPGAGWGAKRWPVERYTAVARELINRGMRIVVNTGPGEEPLAEALVAGAAGAATPLACTSLTCSLAQLIALTRRVSLVIAGDTGPLHLACALARPVVGIYGPTDPSRNGPYGTRFRVLRSPESRRDHTRHAAPEAGLLTIQPEDVLQAANELLTEETTS